MYCISDDKSIKKGKVKTEELITLTGFPMASRNKIFHIKNCDIKSISVVNKKLANPLVTKKLFPKYQKLLDYLTELLIDDDDSGNSFREALNQIEKFRLEIKNKYREFLTRKELEMMSHHLMALQKEAKYRLGEIQYQMVDSYHNHRGK